MPRKAIAIPTEHKTTYFQAASTRRGCGGGRPGTRSRSWWPRPRPRARRGCWPGRRGSCRPGTAGSAAGTDGVRPGVVRADSRARRRRPGGDRARPRSASRRSGRRRATARRGRGSGRGVGGRGVMPRPGWPTAARIPTQAASAPGQDRARASRRERGGRRVRTARGRWPSSVVQLSQFVEVGGAEGGVQAAGQDLQDQDASAGPRTPRVRR